MVAGQPLLAAAIVSVALALVVVARAMGVKERIWAILLFGLFFAAVALVPAEWRDWADWLPLAFVTIVMAIAVTRDLSVASIVAVPVVFGVGFVATLLLRWLIPGGLITVVLLIIGAVALVPAIIAVGNIGRARRAAALKPGEQSGRVGIGGTVAGEIAAFPLDSKYEAAWWSVQVVEGVSVASGDLRFETHVGPAFVEADGATFDFEMSHVSHVAYDDRFEILEKLGAADAVKRLREDAPALEPGEKPDYSGHMTIYWLPAGTEICVIGRPEWEGSHPQVAGYRDTRWVPVFRAAGRKLHVLDRPAEQARRDAWIDAFGWFGCAAVCSAIVALQRLGIA